MTLVTANTILLAIDPGNATGFAWVSAGDDGIFVAESFGSAEVVGRHEAERYFDTAVATGYQLHVVIERFTINAGTHTKSRQMDPLYIIGYVEGMCAKLGIPYTEQTATQAKKFSTDHKLRQIGWYQRTPDGHANDAARHLLARIVNLGAAGREIARRVVADD